MISKKKTYIVLTSTESSQGKTKISNREQNLNLQNYKQNDFLSKFVVLYVC